ncbi:hypothetical protein AB0C34_28225 [Nocardia sp. NPDC049220]|uniref:hypothetical protein n=1 Tax=Nocardia sp. NPDC049220 TaxID=3155273 RepID=UPI00340498F1
MLEFQVWSRATHFPALAVTNETIERYPAAVTAMTRAIVRAQTLLREDLDLATGVRKTSSHRTKLR